MAGGPEKKCVTVRITSENNTAGVSRKGERLILMRITNPRHTPLSALTSSGVCLCECVFEWVCVGDLRNASGVCPIPCKRKKYALKEHIGGQE